MPSELWSSNITVLRLSDDPSFTEDIDTISLKASVSTHIVLDFSAVTVINSSNLAALLRLRRITGAAERKLILCGLSNVTWSTFLATGLDKVFTFSNDVSTALASLQM